MIYWYTLLFTAFCAWQNPNSNPNRDLFMLSEGQITFNSSAPLETITASSAEIKGAIDPATHKFAFSIGLSSFEGFNNPLQKDHFNENFMETNLYPVATFAGKIIEKINFKKEGDYTVRAKGKLKIHGVTKERIIKSNILIKDGKLLVKSVFSVLLKEHNITIPRIVHQKIAKDILVSVDVIFDRPMQ